MWIIMWIALGLIAGIIAKMLMPGDDPGGLIITILLGVAGAVLGGFISVALGVGNGIDDFDFGSLVLAVFGSLLLLAGYRLVAGRGGIHV